MTQLYAIASTFSVGGTFLDWSIYWLTGATQFYNIEQGWLNLTSSPLSNSINAHNHQKNHPVGFKQCKQAVDILTQINGRTSIYTLQAHPEQISINLSLNNKDFSKNYQLILAEQRKDYAAIWSLLQEKNIPIIHVTTKNSLYMQVNRSLDVSLIKQYQSYGSNLDYYKDFAAIFFDTDVTLIEKWNLREMLALGIRPFGVDKIDCLVNFSQPHLYVNANHLFYNGLSCIMNIINYLDLTVDSTRLAGWKKVYSQWQQIQINILKFSWDFNHICDCIVNNYYYDITDYNLDLMQEATILHVLLYKHGLNIKAYGLEKFPNNTQQIHKLLETNNIHKLENIYHQET